jgi:hypothetical protein
VVITGQVEHMGSGARGIVRFPARETAWHESRRRVSDERRAALEAELQGLRIEPNGPGAEDVVAMENRTRRLEILFLLNDRANAEQGLRSTYTGLHEAALAA